MTTSSEVPKADVRISRKLFDFFMGEGPLDGVWFDELNEGFKGSFWWRALLAAAERETLTASRPSPTEEMVERVARAREAVSAARLSLARLVDYAGVHCPSLTDQHPVITNALNAIHSLDVAFPSDTDMGTGLKIGPQ